MKTQKNMKSWKKYIHEKSSIISLAMIAQDYVLFDEEFMSEPKIKRNISNSDFWINLAQTIYDGINSRLIHALLSDDISEIDENENKSIDEMAMMNYIANPENRFEMNDIICDSIQKILDFSSF